MEKNFDEWNLNKKKINNSTSRPMTYKAGQIWWVSCGINVGTEIDGKGELFLRPFLIIKKNDSKSAICLPLTSSKNKKRDYYYNIKIKDKDSVVVFSQIKNIDTKRFYKKYAEISISKLDKIIANLFDYIKSLGFTQGDTGYPNYD